MGWQQEYNKYLQTHYPIQALTASGKPILAVSVNDVVKLVRILKLRKAPDIVGISSEDIRLAPPAVLDILTCLINKAIDTGKLIPHPQNLCDAHIGVWTGSACVRLVSQRSKSLVTFHRKNLWHIQHLPDSTAFPAIHVLIGIPPIETLLHIRALTLWPAQPTGYQESNNQHAAIGAAVPTDHQPNGRCKMLRQLSPV